MTGSGERFEYELRRAARSMPPPGGPCIEPERLADFYRGELAGPDSEELRAHLAACPSCVAVAAEARRFVEAMGGWSGPRAARRAPARIAWWLAAAAAVLVAGLFLQRIASRPPQESASRWASIEIEKAPYPLKDPDESLLWRGGPAGQGYAPGEFVQGMEAYAAGDLEEAARQLDRVVQAAPRHEKARFYLGVTLLLMGRPAESVEHLERAAASASSRLSEEARWYLALACLQSGRNERGLEILEAIAEGPPGEHSAGARELLDRAGGTGRR